MTFVRNSGYDCKLRPPPDGSGDDFGLYVRMALVPWDPFLDQLQTWLEQRDLFDDELRWVVGVSGGPDSTLLLHSLKELATSRHLSWDLHVAHLHHGLRGEEADEDERFVEAIADRMGLPFHSERADIREQVERFGGSTEEVARERRYEFLERVALKCGSDLVAVAHHADDNAETVFHRICRGTGMRGLGGMSDVRAIHPGSRVRLVRPFLQQRHETIERLCAVCGLAPRLDSTNLSSEFTRGKIRNVILPLLREQLNPNITEALLRLAEQARGLGTYLEDAAARTFDSLLVYDAPGQIILNTPALLSKQRIIQAEVIRRAIILVGGTEEDITFSHLESVVRLAEDPASGKELHLPGKLLVTKRYDRLEFRPLQPVEPAVRIDPIYIACPGKTPLSVLGWDLTVELHDIGDEKIDEVRRKRNSYEEWIDLERVHFPLFVRGRQDGDRFRPLGAPGAKTLSDFLGDLKVDPQLRARTGVLCDQEGVIWVMPLRIDERAKLRHATRRAIRLHLTPNTNRS